MRPRGIALVSGLVLLAAVSVLAVTAAGALTLQRKQAGNFQDRLYAESQADLAHYAALAWLYSRPDSDRQADCTDPCFLPEGIRAPGALPAAAEFEPPAWWQANATLASRDPVTGDVAGLDVDTATNGRWIIGEIHYLPVDLATNRHGAAGLGYYRILGRGSGRQVNTLAVTEAIVARPWQGEHDPLAYPPARPVRDFCRQFENELPCGVLAWRTLR
jgi:Tfp pilus assembly protein PilX